MSCRKTPDTNTPPTTIPPQGSTTQDSVLGFMAHVELFYLDDDSLPDKLFYPVGLRNQGNSLDTTWLFILQIKNCPASSLKIVLPTPSNRQT